MSAAGAAPGQAWHRRAVRLAMAAAVVAAVSGVIAAVYFRPRGHEVRGELALLPLALWASTVLRIVHRASTYLLVVAAIAAWVLSRRAPAALPARPRLHSRAICWGLVLAAFLASGLFVPWPKLLPWAPRLGANMARSTTLGGQDGPFPELVGVNVHYDDALMSVAGRRFGPRAVRRLWWFHVVGLPAATVVVIALTRLAKRRRARVG